MYQQSQAYNCPPSQLVDQPAAAGYILDRALWIFGTTVESKMAEAESGATSGMFALSARLRAFARAMGDDMAQSTAGFATPYFDTQEKKGDSDTEILESGF
jgi:hypothetical protein